MTELALALAAGGVSAWLSWEIGGLMQWAAARARLRRVFRPMAPRAGRRALRRDQLKQFPDFLDLLALGASAGMTLEDSWIGAMDALRPGRLKSLLASFQEDLRWGRSKAEAFRHVADGLNDPSLRMTLALIEQAMGHGHLLRDVLLDQARAARQRRWSEIERRVQTTSVRLLLPIFLFIVPAVFLVLFAPLLIRFTQGFDLFF